MEQEWVSKLKVGIFVYFSNEVYLCSKTIYFKFVNSDMTLSFDHISAAPDDLLTHTAWSLVMFILLISYILQTFRCLIYIINSKKRSKNENFSEQNVCNWKSV